MPLPKPGNKIPATLFHVSKLNVRHGQPFGQDAQDQTLIEQLSKGKIVQPFKARPEGHGYGVIVGSRRFQAKLKSGAKTFTVGQDCIIEELQEDEALEQSLIENLDILRKDMDPILRAETFQKIAKKQGLRKTARKMGIAPSTLSEWIQILQLAPEMQQALSKGQIFYKEALDLSKLQLEPQQQKALAETLETQGPAAYQAELARITEGHEKRGLPDSKYVFGKPTFQRNNPVDMQIYQWLQIKAEQQSKDVSEVIKQILIEQWKREKP